jgi:tRNA(Ile)-lysidine synthase
MKGSKKVSDFLNEQKIQSFKKREQMVLLNQDRIVWVLGLRLDERFRVTPETKKVYQLCLS